MQHSAETTEEPCISVEGGSQLPKSLYLYMHTCVHTLRTGKTKTFPNEASIDNICGIKRKFVVLKMN